MSDQNSNRKLTEREQARAEYVGQLCEELQAKGYHRKDLTISITKANVLGFIVCLPFIAAFVTWFIIRNGSDLLNDISVIELILAWALSVALIIVHEGLHGLTWGAFCEKHLKSVEFGFIKSQVTPYCYCREPLKRGAYLLGSLMPFLVLGVIPCVVACLLCMPAWLLLGAVMIAGACGDLLVSFRLMAYRKEGRELICLDHPTECGLILFTR